MEGPVLLYFSEIEIKRSHDFAEKLSKQKLVDNNDLKFLIWFKNRIKLKRFISNVLLLSFLVIYSIALIFFSLRFGESSTQMAVLAFAMFPSLLILNFIKNILQTWIMFSKKSILLLHETLMKYDSESFNPYWFRWINIYSGQRGLSSKEEFERKLVNLKKKIPQEDIRKPFMWSNEFKKTSFWWMRRQFYIRIVDKKVYFKLPVEYGIDAIIWKICNEKANS